ncbi:MAG TPA: hypothetical protein VHX63_07425 [Acidobacteriaceae bacterium]|jgi:urocanate hydratase|nr:hypothetical protein [Acidobacteriaceae bacterium]
MSSSASSPIATGFLPRQHAVYRKYLALQSLASTLKSASLAGSFVVSSGIGREGTELAMASTIAGAAFLGIELRPQRLKSALRNCACDFMVNTLDEALRVLKNEIRKRQPVSVGLLGNAAEILPLLVERGVQPDFLSDTSPLPSLALESSAADTESPGFHASLTAYLEAIRQMAQRGAILIDFGNGLQDALPEIRETIVSIRQIPASPTPADIEPGHPASMPATTPDAIETGVRWIVSGFRDLKQFDTLAASLLPGDDTVRRRWLEGAPACFHRQTPLERVLSLHPEEITTLLQFIRDPAFRNSLEGAAMLHWQDASGAMHTLELAAKPVQPDRDVSTHSAKKQTASNS